MGGEHSQNNKTLERKFILWTIQNDLDGAVGKKTQPSEISIIIESKAPKNKAIPGKVAPDNVTDQQKTTTPRVSNTVIYWLILLIVFIVGGILVYQFVGSRRIDIATDIPRVGNIDLDKNEDKTKFDVPIVFRDATSTTPTSTDLLASTTVATTTTINTTTVNLSTTTIDTTTTADVAEITSTSTPEVEQARSLIPADLVETIEITSLSQIWEKIEEYSHRLYGQDIKLIRLVFVLNDDLGARAPTLEEFIGGFGFSIPRSILTKVNQTLYNFFLFNQDEHFKDIDLKTRSVLLMAVQDQSGLIGLAREWEDFILADLAPRFFLKLTPGKSRSDHFQNSEYYSMEDTMTFRFMNYPDPDVSIDYMIDAARNIFLIAGSRQAAWYVTDAIIKTKKNQ